MLSIPSRINNLLNGNSKMHASVLSIVEKMKPWLNDNKTVFFPEYTDHSFTHINEVLLTADSIISDESWSSLSPEDAAVIVVSTLLHDCAMHITEDGFFTLINGSYTKNISCYIGKENDWNEIWADFLAEAKRFNEKKLIAIMGDATPVRDIPKNKLELTGRDKLLIGEFIRRHHARIAHEIALNGIPGADMVIPIADLDEIRFIDLCGFVARSHNLSLREAVDKLDGNKRQIHLNCRVPFVMATLRISDFIQIHSARAPEKLLNIKALVSPISKGEWKKHDSIVEINHAHQDPEAIYVDAEPDNAITHHQLLILFKSIQYELDSIWSVLGEVYGRYKDLNTIGITIRRIRSSLDDDKYYIATKKPTYIPKVLKFETANAELMELLVAPLYGNNPSIGIRELLQNSIDACIELNDLVIKQKLTMDGNPNHDVLISLYDHEDGGLIVVEDYGIGMTIDVVENYFLNIGASFRNSDRWKKNHETNGHSNVYRTGRFGIGLLAAFLLGDEISVETRHASEEKDKALRFSCKKSGDMIAISHTEFHVGTKITIKIDEKTKHKLLKDDDEWDWYCLSSPKVIRKIISSEEIILDQARNVPNSYDKIDTTDWYRTSADGFDDVTWSYEFGRSTYSGLICNGIIINDQMYNKFDLPISDKLNLITVKAPTLNVFDQDGRLPINLQRTDLVRGDLPFQSELAKDVACYVVKEIISYLKKISIKLEENVLRKITRMNIPGLYRRYYNDDNNLSILMIRNNSVLPLDYTLLKKEKIDYIIIDPANIQKGSGAWTSEEFIRKHNNYILVDNVTGTKSSRSHFVRTYFEFYDDVMQKSSGLKSLPTTGKRIFIKKKDIQEIVSPGYVPKTFWNKLVCEWEDDTWLLLSIGTVPESQFDMQQLSKELASTESFGFVICYLNWEKEQGVAKDSLFSEAWLSINNQSPVLIYD